MADKNAHIKCDPFVSLSSQQQNHPRQPPPVFSRTGADDKLRNDSLQRQALSAFKFVVLNVRLIDENKTLVNQRINTCGD